MARGFLCLLIIFWANNSFTNKIKYFILFVIKQYIFNVALMNLECLLAEVSQFIVAPKSLSFI